MPSIDPKYIADKYNSMNLVWNPADKWHLVTHKMIADFIHNSLFQIGISDYKCILNAGSAGNNYNINGQKLFHIDLAAKKLINISNSIVGNIEQIPFKDKTFDLIICVGSVLNYCDPLFVFSEFSRVIKISGYIILEFENSLTFELLGKTGFNKGVTLVETFYYGSKETIWYFSETYIKNLIELYKFEILRTDKCHIISPLIYRIIKNEKLASIFATLDPFLIHFPIINRFSSNSVLLLQKKFPIDS